MVMMSIPVQTPRERSSNSSGSGPEFAPPELGPVSIVIEWPDGGVDKKAMPEIASGMAIRAFDPYREASTGSKTCEGGEVTACSDLPPACPGRLCPGSL